MRLSALSIQSLRNLQAVMLTPGPDINVIAGVNGSGKTSILEAIYMLGTGRSFRSRLTSRVITHEQVALQVTARLDDEIPIGIEKTAAGDTTLRYNASPVARVADIAQVLPMLLVEPHSFELLESGPKPRRAYLDWCVFHVEPPFYPAWQSYRQLIKQRNALLRQGCQLSDLAAWDNQLVEQATLIDTWRSTTLERLLPYYQAYCQQLLGRDDIVLDYYRGWDRQEPLDAVLTQAFSRDLAVGYSQYGPHRADLRFKVGKTPAVDRLSRGQQKVFVCALVLAQAKLLQEMTGRTCVFLLDDMAAELDKHHREVLFSALKHLDAQVFLTVIEPDVLDQALLAGSTLFHVEHGMVRDRASAAIL